MNVASGGVSVIFRQVNILKENGFNFCPEFTAKVSHLGIKIIEVPVSYYGRTHEEGKKIFFIDGLRAIWAIFKYNLFYKIKKYINI